MAHKGEHRIVAALIRIPRLASGENKARGHALNVPFPGSHDGFVEVIDIEYEPAVGCFERTEVLHVSIAADLGHQMGSRHDRQVGSHERHRTTEESEGRN